MVPGRKPAEPNPAKSNAYDLEPDDFKTPQPQPPKQDENEDIGVIGQAKPKNPVPQQKPAAIEEPDEDLNQSAEEI